MYEIICIFKGYFDKNGQIGKQRRICAPSRKGRSGGEYASGGVASMNGLIIFPDAWAAGSWLSDAMQNKVNASYINDSHCQEYGNTVITADEWLEFEAAGCVFLPSLGHKYGQDMNYVRQRGRYWTSTADGNSNAISLYFWSDEVSLGSIGRGFGLFVRLVQNK